MILRLLLLFLGGFMCGYVIALLSPEEEPGGGVSKDLIIIRAVIFAFGVMLIGGVFL